MYCLLYWWDGWNFAYEPMRLFKQTYTHTDVKLLWAYENEYKPMYLYVVCS